MRALTSAVGATLDEQSLRNDAIVVDAPKGKVWSASGSHAMRADFANIPRCEAIEDIGKRMGLGLDACGDSDCEVCSTTTLVGELTACCSAATTFHDAVECCKVCFREVIR